MFQLNPLTKKKLRRFRSIKRGYGSFLIETIFDIDGFGLLGFNSVIDRDYPVVMGILTLSATLMLLGNILSDALVALVDPRVRFE